MIQLFQPNIGQAEVEAVTEVLLSGWLGMGPKTAEFEERFAQYIGTKYAVGLNSATAALHLALKLLSVGPGEEVIVPTITFVSTAHAVMYCGARPVFADVDKQTMSITPSEVGRLRTDKTKAVIVVHYGGRPVDIGDGVPVVEDAAHACGGSFLGRKCGSLGDIGCFSFHAVKNLATGDGGMLTTDDKSVYDRAKRLRWLGIDKSTWDRSEGTYQWSYRVGEVGLKCHMNDITAAIGLVQLGKLDKANERRREIAMIYSQGFRDQAWIVGMPPDDTQAIRSAWHLYWLRVPKRDELMQFLKEHDIITGVHYQPIHTHKCYGFAKPYLPVAEKVVEELMSLPMHPGLTDGDVGEVVGRVAEFGRTRL